MKEGIARFQSKYERSRKEGNENRFVKREEELSHTNDVFVRHGTEKRSDSSKRNERLSVSAECDARMATLEARMVETRAGRETQSKSL